MSKNRYKKLCSIFLIMLVIISGSIESKPQLTVVLVIDQCAYRYLTKLYPHLNYGIKTLIDNGINYTNAHHPHAKPATATGHAALQTGAYARDHGFIANKWMLPDGVKTNAVFDNTQKGRLLTSPEHPELGASSRYLMTDGISDQFVLSGTPDEPHHVYSLSYKNRAAIATAGKLGKAIWFDQTKGLFSSSKEYFDTLPSWVKKFNVTAGINTLSEFKWKLAYSNVSSAYNFFDIDDYRFSRPQRSIIGSIKLNENNPDKDRYYWYVRSPEANKQLLHLAKQCIVTHVSPEKNDHMLLWICVSGLDKLGHVFGPESKEMIDMIYHLDKDIGEFMAFMQNYMGKNNVLFTFTADHGVTPPPELLHEKGINFATRTDKSTMHEAINRHLYDIFAKKDIVADIAMPHINLNKKIFTTFDEHAQQKVLDEIKTFFMNISEVKGIWTAQELYILPAEKYSFIDRLKKQCYPNRSGDLLFQLQPFAVITGFPRGANHKTPYNYDTHVPFIIYQSDVFEHKIIHAPVWTTQFANTLSQILGTPQPSCADLEVLPGLFE